jgi:hypothetical protein
MGQAANGACHRLTGANLRPSADSGARDAAPMREKSGRPSPNQAYVVDA